jgi:uroporphyrinogen-III synthase
MSPARPLANVGVLVTRPLAQAAGFAARLRDLGANPLSFPALAILPATHPDALRAILAGIEGYDLAIFISPTAAEWGLAGVAAWPAGVAVAAVGRGTAQALAARGVTAMIVPDAGADSEHLLALPALAETAGKRILIFRGEGGRELLADRLRAGGARVDYAECYRRGRPESDPAPVLEALAKGGLQAITVFSGETLDNLLDLMGEAAPTLFPVPLFAPHARIADHARARGFATVRATAPGESGLITGLVEYFAHV